MNPVLYESNTTSFTTNGLGRLTDCISCVVQEVINGVYELEMTYPIDGAHYSLIQEHRILYVPHDDTKAKQPFEIYRISRPINGKVTINAWHISYRLRKMVCMPFKADSASDAMSGIESNIVGSNSFTFTSLGVSTSATMNPTVPVAVKSLMGGMEGSVIDTFGGEWEYDHFVCTLKNRRGIDTNVSIRYGKNLTDIKKTSDVTDLWSGIIPYWAGAEEDGAETAVWYDGIIYSPARQDYPYDMVIAVDASASFETEPTQAQLQSWGQSYVSSHAKSAIPTSIEVSFIELWQTEEYKNVSALQRLGIGDTVHVYYDKLGVDNTARIVSYRYNVLLERYDSMTLGNVRASFASAVREDISGIANDIRRSMPSKSFIQRAIDHQTELITGGLGGYVIMSLNANDEPEEILVMDNPDKTRAVNVLRINRNGIGFSTHGYNGPFDTAWTIDGNFNASFITAGTMLADRIKGGSLKLGGTSFGNGVLEIYDANDVRIARWDRSGLYFGNIASDLTTPNFKIDTAGNVTSKSMTAEVSGKISQFNFDADRLTYNNGGIGGAYDWNRKDRIYIGKKGIALTKQTDEHSVVLHDGQVIFGTLNIPGFAIGSSPDSNNGWWNEFEIFRPDDLQTYMYCNRDGSTTMGFDVPVSFWDDATVQDGAELTVMNDLRVYGDLYVFKTKDRIVNTEDYGKRALYCYETSSPYFGDIGEGVIGEDGLCYIPIDAILAETVNLKTYQVFLQAYSKNPVSVIQRTPGYFVVDGTPGDSFGWELKAKQLDFDQRRLEMHNEKINLKSKVDYAKINLKSEIDYADEAINHINEIKEERIA